MIQYHITLNVIVCLEYIYTLNLCFCLKCKLFQLRFHEDIAFFAPHMMS